MTVKESRHQKWPVEAVLACRRVKTQQRSQQCQLLVFSFFGILAGKGNIFLWEGKTLPFLFDLKRGMSFAGRRQHYEDA
jgi:hypothetical protein